MWYAYLEFIRILIETCIYTMWWFDHIEYNDV